MAAQRKSLSLRRLIESVRRFDAAAAVEIGGRIAEAGPGYLRVTGLGAYISLGDRIVGAHDARIQSEVIRIGPDGALAKLYGADTRMSLGAEVYRAAPIGVAPCNQWRGRIINAVGEPVDGAGPLPAGSASAPLDRAPPQALSRQRVRHPLKTGVRAIDAFAPLCFGQRIGIFAGSGVGKSTLLGMLAKSDGFDEVVIGLVGERGRELREFAEDVLGDRRKDAIVIAATGDESALMRRLAGHTSLAIAEWFRDRGRRVLLILDSVTRFAQASREIAIAAGEPPVARGYPPSVFADLPRLLERAGPGDEGSGSITGVFSVLVDGDDHNDPVADVIRGILDGHIVLDRSIADQGRYPAINLLSSISRLADQVWTPDRRSLVVRLRGLIARYEDSRDFRAIGGYQPGAEADLDAAVDLVPKLYAALIQASDADRSVDAFREISDALRSAEPKP